MLKRVNRLRQIRGIPGWINRWRGFEPGSQFSGSSEVEPEQVRLVLSWCLGDALLDLW